MRSIEGIDKNFKIETSIEKEGLKFYDTNSAPFKISGIYTTENIEECPKMLQKIQTKVFTHFIHAQQAEEYGSKPTPLMWQFKPKWKLV